MARVIKLILSSRLEGSGKDGDPVRMVHELFSLDGEPVAVWDAFSGRSWANLSAGALGVGDSILWRASVPRCQCVPSPAKTRGNE